MARIRMHRVQGVLIYLTIFAAGISFAGYNIDFSGSSKSHQGAYKETTSFNLGADAGVCIVGNVQLKEGCQIRWIRTMREEEPNAVVVTVYTHQGRWDEVNRWYCGYEPETVEQIQVAELAGFKAVVSLRIDFDRPFYENVALCHGPIRLKTDHALQMWFEEFKEFEKAWGIISELDGVACSYSAVR